MKFNDLKAELLEGDAELKKEYEALTPQYQVISAIIKARTERNMTQRELAEKVCTAQSNISRLESGHYNPSLAFLQKVATALNKDIHITLDDYHAAL